MIGGNVKGNESSNSNLFGLTSTQNLKLYLAPLPLIFSQFTLLALPMISIKQQGGKVQGKAKTEIEFKPCLAYNVWKMARRKSSGQDFFFHLP